MLAGGQRAQQGDPVKNILVQILNSSGTQIATAKTDEGGWYMVSYKQTGKASTFTIKLPDYHLSKTVSLKANSFAQVNFNIP